MKPLKPCKDKPCSPSYNAIVATEKKDRKKLEAFVKTMNKPKRKQ